MMAAASQQVDLQEASQAPAAFVSASLNDGKQHLLLAASGSVAVVKLHLIISAFRFRPNLSIRIILTDSATRFLTGKSPEQPTVSSLASLANVDGVYVDQDEWSVPWSRNSKILHIELRRWAHLLTIVPMSANLLAKAAGGLCDDLVTNVIRAWDTKRAIIAAPAMNDLMWVHPVTAKHIVILTVEWGWYEVLRPQVKALACGDVGDGAMCDWNEIVAVIEERLAGLELPCCQTREDGGEDAYR